MRTILYILIITMIPFLQGCSQSYKTNGMVESEKFDKKLHFLLDNNFPVISVDSLRNSRDDFILLDARSREEFDVSRIKGAHYVGYKDFNISELPKIPENKTAVVYCSVGYRSEKIAKEIQEETGHKALNLYGSIFEWANRGYPIVTGNNNKTDKIHAYNRKWSKWITNDSLNKVW